MLPRHRRPHAMLLRGASRDVPVGRRAVDAGRHQGQRPPGARRHTE